MILYFTGTGNSEYAAKKLAAALGEETMPLMERIRHNDTSPLESETPWIVCTPTYAWHTRAYSPPKSTPTSTATICAARCSAAARRSILL